MNFGYLENENKDELFEKILQQTTILIILYWHRHVISNVETPLEKDLVIERISEILEKSNIPDAKKLLLKVQNDPVISNFLK